MTEIKNKVETTDREAARHDVSHWTFINQWQVEAQSTDRMPVHGIVPHEGGTASVRRSVARRAHQLGYKKWSKQRHD